jgi:predicted RNA-binding Zn-ribbon protein involved in translation (DUF1610 family)
MIALIQDMNVQRSSAIPIKGLHRKYQSHVWKVLKRFSKRRSKMHCPNDGYSMDIEEMLPIKKSKYEAVYTVYKCSNCGLIVHRHSTYNEGAITKDMKDDLLIQYKESIKKGITSSARCIALFTLEENN